MEENFSELMWSWQNFLVQIFEVQIFLQKFHAENYNFALWHVVLC